MREIRKKIILLGDIGVGKTSLIRRFVLQEFSDTYLSTIGVRVDKKTVSLESEIVHLLIWDLAGEIMSNKAYASYLQGAAGVIGVFDLTRPESFDNLNTHLLHIQSNSPDTRVMILANKSDLVTEPEILKFDNKAEFITSAKTGMNVEEAFLSMAQTLILS